jgi:hypothetical protein
MKIASSMLILMIACSPCLASTGGSRDLADFPYSAIIKGPLEKGALYRVALPGQVLRHCTRDCTDGRIFDQKGKEIPYVIIESRGDNTGGERYLFEITGYEETRQAETFALRLPEKHRAVSTIQISTRDRDFRKKIRVYGSRDLKTWSLVTQDTIWDFSSQADLRKTEIHFPESDYRYYRLLFTKADGKGTKAESIRLKYRGLDFSAENARPGRMRIVRIEGSTPGSRVRPVYDEFSFTRFSSQRDGDRTIIESEAPVPFERVSFDIANSYYFRKVGIYFSEDGKKGSYRFVAAGQVYSFPLSETIETRNWIDCPGSGKGHYRFVIENRGNPPLEIGNIIFRRVRRNLYFIALSDSSPYTLWLGNSSVKKPEYDIAHFINQCNWQIHPAKELEIAQVTENAKFIPAADKGKGAAVEKKLLMIIVSLLVGVIGYWLYSLVRSADLKREKK